MRDPQSIFDDLFTHRGNYTQYNTPNGQLDLIRFAQENQLGNYTHPDSPDKGLWILPPITFAPEWNTTDVYVANGDLSQCLIIGCDFVRSHFDTVKFQATSLTCVQECQFHDVEISDNGHGDYLFVANIDNTRFSNVKLGSMTFSEATNCEVSGGQIGLLHLSFASSVTVKNVNVDQFDLSLVVSLKNVRFIDGCRIRSVSRPDFRSLQEINGLDLEGSEVNNWDASGINFNQGIRVNNHTKIKNSNFDKVEVCGEYVSCSDTPAPDTCYKGLELREYFKCQGAELDNVNFGHNPISLVPTSTPAPPKQPLISTTGIILMSTLIPGGLIIGTVLGVVYSRYRKQQNARTNLDIFREEQLKQDRKDARIIERLSQGDVDRLLDENLLEAHDQIIPFFQAGERRAVLLPREIVKKIMQMREGHSVVHMNNEQRDDRDLAFERTWIGIKQSRFIANKIQVAKYYLQKGLSLFSCGERAEESRDVPLQEIVIAGQENRQSSRDGKDKGEMDETTPLLGSTPAGEMMLNRR